MLMRNSEHRKELISEIRSLAQSQGLNTVFTTFLEITANSLAAQTDPENAEKREQRYQEMASTMTPELLSSYARMLALLFLTVREYRDDPCDILGGIYHELNLNNEWNGQYFTPDDICRFMAQITLPSDELSVKDGPITINEPTCGSGTMVIGAIWAIYQFDKNVNRKQQEKASEIAQDFANNFIERFSIISKVLLKNNEMRKMLSKIANGELKSFTRIEILDAVGDKNCFNKYSQIVKSKKTQNRYETILNKLYNEKEKEKFNSCFPLLVENTLNQLEAACINISSNAAGSEYIYNSLHQSFLQFVEVLSIKMIVEAGVLHVI